MTRDAVSDVPEWLQQAGKAMGEKVPPKRFRRWQPRWEGCRCGLLSTEMVREKKALVRLQLIVAALGL